MIPLGVFSELYGDGMNIPIALRISLVGFLLVFVILGVLALFVKGQGRVFDTLDKKRRQKQAAALAAAPAVPAPAPAQRDPDAGKVTLVDVSEEEAAVVMAVVAHNLGTDPARLNFHSIRLLEDKQ